MRILVCTEQNDAMAGMVDEITNDPVTSLVAVAHDGVSALALLRDGVDVTIASQKLIDMSILIHREAKVHGFSSNTKRVVATENPSPSLLVKAHQYGFDDVVDIHSMRSRTVERLKSLIEGDSEFQDNSLFSSLSLRHSLFTREINVEQGGDLDIIDLMGIGLTDDDISTVLGLSSQHVRNRIADLLYVNGLARRTQLVALRNSHVHLPEYVI